MEKYKKKYISFNEDKDLPKESGKLKTDLDLKLGDSLESLSFEGVFNSNPVKINNTKIEKKSIEVDLKKKRKKKGNELI